jgi:hypothetical protein
VRVVFAYSIYVGRPETLISVGVCIMSMRFIAFGHYLNLKPLFELLVPIRYVVVVLHSYFIYVAVLGSQTAYLQALPVLFYIACFTYLLILIRTTGSRSCLIFLKRRHYKEIDILTLLLFSLKLIRLLATVLNQIWITVSPVSKTLLCVKDALLIQLLK